jgi:hypothetical protein
MLEVPKALSPLLSVMIYNTAILAGGKRIEIIDSLESLWVISRCSPIFI